MKNSSRPGFALPQVLLILLALGIISGVGYYVYKANQNINSNLDTTANSQNTPQKSEKKSDETEDRVTPTSTIPAGWVKFSDDATGVSFYHPADIKGTFKVSKHDIDEDIALGYGAPVWWRYDADKDSWQTYQISPKSTGTDIIKKLADNQFTYTKDKVGGKATFTDDVGEGGSSSRVIVFPSGKYIYRINYPAISWRSDDTSTQEEVATAQEASVEQLIKSIKL